jgi:hypothetical protein
VRATIERAGSHLGLLAVPAAAWALARLRSGDAADALLHTAWLLVLVVPLAGVARASRRRTGAGVGVGLSVVASLALSVGLVVAASALLTLTALGGQAVGFVATSHAALAAVALALAGIGALIGTLFDDALDAAAVSLTIALLTGGGLLVAGAWVGAVPRPLVDSLIAANPFIAVAAAAQVDVSRLELFYRISPLAHIGVEYPVWYVTCARYSAVAAVCCTVVCLRFRAPQTLFAA